MSVLSIDFGFSVDVSAAKVEVVSVDEISLVDDISLVNKMSDESVVEMFIGVDGRTGVKGKHDVVLKQKLPTLPSLKNPKRLEMMSDCLESC